jgi:2-phospho-L-lactate transferase/gluconeogenesis factor (CofD/UPF0052 family)
MLIETQSNSQIQQLKSRLESLKIVLLVGGVGGAKLADGFARLIAPENLTIIVNTGDDFTHLGLHISPDVDTVMYTLAGVANPETGAPTDPDMRISRIRLVKSRLRDP